MQLRITAINSNPLKTAVEKAHKATTTITTTTFVSLLSYKAVSDFLQTTIRITRVK